MTDRRIDANPAQPLLDSAEVIGGVDTHHDTHVFAALDGRGGLLATAAFPATRAGYAEALAWLGGFGEVHRVGVEGTGSYGAGLARFLAGQAIEVLEVCRPNRAERRRRGKSDPIDAENAARAVLAGHATAIAKSHDGQIECLRILKNACDSAKKARTAAINQIHNTILCAPDTLREQLENRTGNDLLTACRNLRPHTATDPIIGATKRALRDLARRVAYLDTEITDHKRDLAALTNTLAPTATTAFGAGPDTTAQLLITIGDNPHRLHSEAAFAHLCGVSPIPASSGRTNKHRLNRGGDRQANKALHTIALCRLAHDPRTRAYAARRTTQGLSKRDIIRCLKRAIAREMYKHLRNHHTQPQPLPQAA